MTTPTNNYRLNTWHAVAVVLFLFTFAASHGAHWIVAACLVLSGFIMLATAEILAVLANRPRVVAVARMPNVPSDRIAALVAAHVPDPEWRITTPQEAPAA